MKITNLVIKKYKHKKINQSPISQPIRALESQIKLKIKDNKHKSKLLLQHHHHDLIKSHL